MIFILGSDTLGSVRWYLGDMSWVHAITGKCLIICRSISQSKSKRRGKLWRISEPRVRSSTVWGGMWREVSTRHLNRHFTVSPGHLNHSLVMVFLDTIPASMWPVWVPTPSLWMPLMILETALQTGNFRLINLAFLVPREMKLVSSKLDFPRQALSSDALWLFRTEYLEELEAAPGVRGLILPILLPLGAEDPGLSSCLQAGLYFRKDWTNLCPETGC